MSKGVQPVCKGPRGDDFLVMSFGRVDVVIVIVEPGILQTCRVLRRQHAESHAGLHAERLDALDHGDDRIHVALLGRAPGRAHAIAGRARVARFLRLRNHALHLNELRGLQARLVMRRLAAIAAILRAAAGLDRQELTALDRVRLERGAMDEMGAKQEVVEGQVIERLRLFPGPVVADLGLAADRSRQMHVDACSCAENLCWGRDTLLSPSGAEALS